MKRIIITSSILVLGIALPVMANAQQVRERSVGQLATEVEAPGGDAMTYFASGEYLKNQAQQLQAMEPAAGPGTVVDLSETASLNGAEIRVEQGRVQSAFTKTSTVQNTTTVKNLNDQLPSSTAPSTLGVKSEKVLDSATGIKTNIIMNTDTGVDIGR